MRACCSAAPRRRGAVYPLVLEPFAANPQLEAERPIVDSTDLDLPLYHDPRRSLPAAVGK